MHTCIDTYVQMYIYAYINTYAYAYTCKYTYTRVHVCMYTEKPQASARSEAVVNEKCARATSSEEPGSALTPRGLKRGTGERRLRTQATSATTERRHIFQPPRASPLAPPANERAARRAAPLSDKCRAPASRSEKSAPACPTERFARDRATPRRLSPVAPRPLRCRAPEEWNNHKARGRNEDREPLREEGCRRNC